MENEILVTGRNRKIWNNGNTGAIQLQSYCKGFGLYQNKL